MAITRVRYAAAGWGFGELGFDGDLLVWHELPRGGASRDDAPHPFAERLVAYFGGDEIDFGDVDVLADETPFGEELTKALRAVPRGHVVTYGELAGLAGRPGAARAAGTFCACNRLPIVVPCHRVVAARGLGGYGTLGLAYKRRLLELER